MKKIQIYLITFILVTAAVFLLLPSSSVGAANALDAVCADNPGDSAVCANKDDSSNTLVNDIVNTLLFLVGAVSVISIIIGGILYVTSSGDSSNVTKAKNIIVYAVIGLVVALLAYAIVNWVVDLF